MSLLEVSDVTVRFGGNLALDAVSLQVSAGSVTGLIGPNGAGKTTMFNVITGLQPVDAGRVALDGTDITGVRPFRRARAGIARTFQRLESFGSMTVRENILVAAEVRRDRDGAAPRMATDALLDRLSLGDVADERTEELPTGRARLVEIARALATRPKLLLLDEPASGLSETEGDGLAVLLTELAQGGLGILLVEHDVPLVMRVCAQIFVLDFGAVLASGSAREIQADRNVQEAYLGTTEVVA
ncbi:MAG TPA: ABC transporter ATP-binding protein [Acidimicrobiales bacterium]|nr:ABC transporter ATP-binding protein [Acidimicrobiales bacterium]